MTANQRRTEPFPPTEGHPAPSGTTPASNDPGRPSPERAPSSPERAPSSPERASSPPGVDSPGDAQGVPVVSPVPLDGTSEEQPPVRGVRVSAVAPPGLADGEPDDRAPSTGVF
jgi:hypothetical protein